MKKTLVALAVLAASGAAMAQSSVTIWGVADAGYQSAKQNNVTKNIISSSGLSSSQLGFRGTEDLGGGMSANFWLEAGMTVDNGTAGSIAFQRRSTVDLAGSAGAIRIGRDYTPSFWNHTVFDPFGTLGSGAGSNITGRGQNATTGARTNNGVSYLYGYNANSTSNLGKGGVYVQATTALGEQLSNVPQTNKYTGIRIGYTDGPLNVAVASANVVNGLLKDKEMNIGASYDLGVAKLMAKTGTNTLNTAIAASGLIPAVTAAEYKWSSIGATIPMGGGYVPLSWNTSKNNKDSKQANLLAVGYVHNLSKRTALYGTYSKINNKNGATYGFNGGNGGFGSGLAPIGNGTGTDLGIRHSF
jgi:predicted porin